MARLPLPTQTTSSGLRAAILGQAAARFWLALAVVLSGLAALTHPRGSARAAAHWHRG